MLVRKIKRTFGFGGKGGGTLHAFTEEFISQASKLLWFCVNNPFTSSQLPALFGKNWTEEIEDWFSVGNKFSDVIAATVLRGGANGGDSPESF